MTVGLKPTRPWTDPRTACRARTSRPPRPSCGRDRRPSWCTDREDRSWPSRRGKVRILDEPHQVSEWIGHGRHPNRLPHILNGRLEGCPLANEVLDRFFYIGNAPVCDRASGARLDALGIRIEPELVASNV